MLQADLGLLVNGDDGDAAFDDQKGTIGRIALCDDALAGSIEPMFDQVGKEFDDLWWRTRKGFQLPKIFKIPANPAWACRFAIRCC